MVELKKITGAKGFEYSSDPQRSPEWVNKRVGRVTASRLKDWLAVAKKDGKTPLKARLDYERELAYEMKFGVPYKNFATVAMEEGQQWEAFVIQQYSSAMGVVVDPAGMFYNEDFAASPDGLVGDDGLIEAKWFYDNSFSDVLVNGVPDDYMLQMQGQLYASGRKWVDFVVGNANSRRFKVIRVERDEDIIARIAESLPARKKIDFKFDDENLFTFSDTIETSQNGEWS